MRMRRCGRTSRVCDRGRRPALVVFQDWRTTFVPGRPATDPQARPVMKPGRDHSIGAAAAKAGPGRATGCRIAQDTRLPSRKGAPRGRRRDAAAAGCTRATAPRHLRGDAAPSSRVAAGHPPDAGAPDPGLAGPARGRPGGDLPAGPRTGPARPAGFHRQGRSGSRSRANGLIICSPTSACRGRGSSRPMSFPAASALWPWPKGFGTSCGRQAAPRRPVAPSAFRAPGRVHRTFRRSSSPFPHSRRRGPDRPSDAMRGSVHPRPHGPDAQQQGRRP